MDGWQVTANDIKHWAETNKRKAEETLPLLVRRLIFASCTPSVLDFPSGDSVATGGWDGVLEVEVGNSFIPSGKSGWEFGTNQKIGGKVEDDYAKRSEKPEPLAPKETTFVFATTQHWSKRDNWVRTKQSEGRWKDVRGINADSLECWLEACPSVHRWFSQLLGKRSSTLWDIDQAWHEYIHQTELELTSEFLLHDREEQLAKLHSLLGSKPAHKRFASTSKNEAYGFMLAALRQSTKYSARALIVRSQNEWDYISSSESTLILLPVGFIPTGIGAAVANGHFVLIAEDAKERQTDAILLPHQPRLIREEGLKKLGFDERTASALFAETKGFLEPILRNPLMRPRDRSVPGWPTSTSTNVLFATFFASEWKSDNQNDWSILEALSGMGRSELEEAITSLSMKADPPIREIGRVWQVISKMDYWLQIAPILSRPCLERLERVVCLVLSDADPSFDMSADERFMSTVRAKYSGRLKRGIADTLALLAVHGDDYTANLSGSKPSDQIRYWIRELFKENHDTRFWFSLGSCTELLAEASPSEFLEAVEAASEGNSSSLQGLFESEGEGLFGGGCYHSNLLWALEQFSWDKSNFSRACLCLARLAEIDPGGRWGNRPFNSLVDIFLGWINNTSVTHSERLNVLEKLIIPQYPDIAWRLMVALLMNNTQTSSGVSKASYRDWSNGVGEVTSHQEYCSYVSSIVDLLSGLIGQGSAERLCDLIGNFDSYSKEQTQLIVDTLLEYSVEGMETEQRDLVLNKLRDTLNHHREFPDAGWSWPEALLGQLEEIYEYFNYSDLLRANLFLFNDHWPKLIKPLKRKEVDHDERERNISELRINTVEAIHDDLGDSGVIQLISECAEPRIAGWAVCKSRISKNFLNISLEWLEKKDFRYSFADRFINCMYRDDVQSAAILLKSAGRSWSMLRQARFILALQVSAESLELLETLPTKAQEMFWSELNSYYVSDDEAHLVPFLASKFLEHKRPCMALKTIGQLFYSNKKSTVLDDQLIASILLKIITDPCDKERVALQGLNNEIVKAIEFIQDSGKLELGQIHTIEWGFLGLGDRAYRPRYLSKLAAEDPSFFVQLIRWCYKPDNGQADEKDGEVKQAVANRAEGAYYLLRKLDVIPGQRDGAIDEAVLNQWVASARKELSEVGRVPIGDDRIGNLLASCSEGKDGIWPHDAVRSVIENVRSNELDSAISCGKKNARGVTVRHPYSGGKQEHDLAEQYLKDAENLQLVYPRTSEMLRSISRSYAFQAEREDQAVEAGR